MGQCSEEGIQVLNIIKLILAIVFLVLGAAFAIINDQAVRIDLYFLTPTLPLSLLLLLAVGVGIVLGALASVFYFMRIKKENADLRRKTRLVEQEVKSLRTMPINGR